MFNVKSVAVGALVVSAGCGLASASPALADTVHPTRPAATSRQALTRPTVRPAAHYVGTTSRTTYKTYATSTWSTRTYATSSSSTGTYTATSSNTSTSTAASATAASSTTSTSTSTTVAATGACTLGTSASGTTCNQAIAYMLAQKASGSTAWHNRCLGLVSQAYGGAFSGYGTAAQAAAAVSAAGLMHTTSDLTTIPRGAVVWFTNSSGAGHVVISLGNGLAISSDVANGSLGTGSGAVGVVSLSYFTQSWGQTLIGWSAPRA